MATVADRGLVRIEFADDELERFANMLGALGEADARKALSRAVNRVTRTVEGRVVRAIAKQSSIPAKIVRASVKSRLSAHKGTGPISGVVIATGEPISLKHFGARQFSFGVRAKIWGEVRRFPGTFIFAGTFRSGKPVAGGHVWQRTSKKSLPIEKQLGPNVPDEMVRSQSLRVYEETVRTMLPARAQHEIGRILDKG